MTAAPRLPTSDLEIPLRRLKRGLMTSDERTTLTAYKQLFEAGAIAVPILERELRNAALYALPARDEATRLLAGLLALHRDLDEAASDHLIDEALTRQCPDVISALLRAARCMSCRDFRISDFGIIQIWEHSSIDQRYTASLLIQDWLKELPENDIAGIRRVVITVSKPEDDALGSYMPVLGVVSLAWTILIPPESFFVRVSNAIHRLTLFHEVGHHVHRHWFGQDPEQELDAESYAVRSARTRLPLWLRTCLPLVGAMSRVFGWWDAHWPSTSSKISRTRP